MTTRKLASTDLFTYDWEDQVVVARTTITDGGEEPNDEPFYCEDGVNPGYVHAEPGDYGIVEYVELGPFNSPSNLLYVKVVVRWFPGRNVCDVDVDQIELPEPGDVFAEIAKAVLEMHPDVVRVDKGIVEVWPNRREKGWTFTVPTQDRPKWGIYKRAILDEEDEG